VSDSHHSGSGIDQLRDAFRRRDVAAIRRLVAEHPALRERINDPIAAFDSPPIVAYANDPDLVDVLLELGADPNRRSEWWAGGFHALHSATGAAADRLIAAGAGIDACAAAHLDRLDVLRRLLDEDPSRVHERGGDGQTPLHFAVSRAAIDLLLTAGADIDARDVDHRSTPAQWMLAERRGAGRYDCAGYLVEHGASVDIFLAAALGLTDRALELIEVSPATLDQRTGLGEYGERPPSSYHVYFWSIGPGRSPLDVASQFEHEDTLQAMMERASPVQRLLFAARHADEAEARSLVREHPGLVEAMSPSQHRALADAAWSGDGSAVSLMLSLGFDPRIPGHDGGSALHLAAWDGAATMVEMLLRDPRALELLTTRDAHHGGTPLGWCCHGSVHNAHRGDHAAVARLLLDAGAKPNGEGEDAAPAVQSVLRERVSSG
jgi:ankyrin repeat protein